MGLPNISINFKRLANEIIKRSEKGIVALILRDTKVGVKEYKMVGDVVESGHSAANLDLIKKCFMGSPSKVIVVSIATATPITEALAQLDLKRFNYLAVPQMTVGEVDNIKSYISNGRLKKRVIKAVLANVVADSENIINCTTEGNNDGTKTYTALEYTVRVAGILAGLSLKRSSTYYVLEELKSITEKVNPDASIDAGELIFINDGEKIKIGRGVNSLTTITSDKTEDYKKIKIIEGMDMIREDVKKTFEDIYCGQILNDYDNKCLLFNAINGYLGTLVTEGVLDRVGENKVKLDIGEQIAYLKSKNVNTDLMSIEEIKDANTDTSVFALANVKFLDAMEDFKFNIFM